MHRILIVEDDTFLLEMLVKKSKEANFTVEIATDGEDALKKIEGGSFDLVLLDLVLPKLQGLKILEKLRENPDTPPIIVLSNLYDQESKKKAEDLGVKGYIIKAQSTPQDIVDEVKSFLTSKEI